MTPEELASMRVELEAWTSLIGERLPVARVEDVLLAPGLRGRRYRPDGAGDAVLVWFHGGGYVSGTLDGIDPTCRWLARGIGCTVVSVDYRLAPEHPFPAGLDDGVAALAAVAAACQGPIAIGGDSAGGGLAAAVAGLTTVPLAGMLLLCPWLDLTVRDTGVMSALTRESLRAFADFYVGPAGDRCDPRASPLLASSVPSVPTLIVAAEQDSLGYQAVEYAARLSSCELRVWPQDHGFVGFTKDLAEAREALDWACACLRALLPRRG